MNRGRTITISARRNPGIEERLESACKASTGPCPSITGMRNLYWGKDALIVKCGAYIYYFGKDVGQNIGVLYH